MRLWVAILVSLMWLAVLIGQAPAAEGTSPRELWLRLYCTLWPHHCVPVPVPRPLPPLPPLPPVLEIEIPPPVVSAPDPPVAVPEEPPPVVVAPELPPVVADVPAPPVADPLPPKLPPRVVKKRHQADPDKPRQPRILKNRKPRLQVARLPSCREVCAFVRGKTLGQLMARRGEVSAAVEAHGRACVSRHCPGAIFGR